MVNRIIIREKNEGDIRTFPDFLDDLKYPGGIRSGFERSDIGPLDNGTVSQWIRERYPSSRISAPDPARVLAIATDVP